MIVNNPVDILFEMWYNVYEPIDEKQNLISNRIHKIYTVGQ